MNELRFKSGIYEKLKEGQIHKEEYKQVTNFYRKKVRGAEALNKLKVIK